MSFRFIAAWQGAHTVVRLCRTVGVTRADGALAVRIRAIFAASHATYGVPASTPSCGRPTGSRSAANASPACCADPGCG